MITSIQLSSILPDYKNIDSAVDEIQNLSRLNIFIWANNSGKSRFLREILLKSWWLFKDSKVDYSGILKSFKDTISKWINQMNKGEVRWWRLPQSRLVDFYGEYELIDDWFISNKRYPLVDEIKKQLSISPWIFEWFENNSDWYLSDIMHKFVNNVTNSHSSYDFLYIPLLRWLRPLIKQEWKFTDDDVYLDRIRKDYSMNWVEIFTWLKLYEDLLSRKRSKKSDRRNIEDFEKFLWDKFFQWKTVDITPNKDDDTVHISIEDDENPIYNVWDWIGALINILYPLFTHRWEKLMIGIEEPETHLHPSMQRILLETLMDERFSSFQYFITTHSNHFLDMTIDRENISVYTFEKKWEIFEIDNIANDNMKSLELLWVRNSAVFLANCSIWVEWITDRIYLRKILELTQIPKDIKFNEDYHFTFIEYGWANITHWWFTDEEEPVNFERISNRVFLISDTDWEDILTWSTKKAQRLRQLQTKLDDNFYPLECREIENLLSPKMLKSILIEDEKMTEEDDLLDYEDYKNEWLWRFLDTKFWITKYSTTSWTIKGKVDFARKAVRHIQSIDDLSEEAKILWEKIYAFIKSHNT